MKRILLFFFALIFMQDVWAQPTGSLTGTQVTINGLNYRLYEATQEATLDNGNSWEGFLSLPSVVNYNGKDYTVTRIGWLAFAFCETLTKVKIPKTVTDIQHYAGYEVCKNPFSGCTSLETIVVDEENPSMCSVDGVLFNKDKTKLYCYPAGAKAKSYNVPNEVTWIGGNAFADNLYLRTIEIPNSVTFLGFGAFSGCRNLESVRLSENLKYIHAFTFDHCESLHVLDIPKNVSEFEESVFRWTHLDALVVRGTFPAALRSDIFYFVDDSTIIYAQPSEISKIKEVFSGTVLPLEEYKGDISTHESDNDYRPLVEEGKRWTYDNYLDIRPEEYNHYYWYELNGDTVIAGQECLKMYSENRFNNGEVSYEGAFYERGKKVYYFAPEKDEAVLLYDFSCQIGDSVKTDLRDMIVSNIYIEKNGARDLRMTELIVDSPYKQDPLDRVRWIEGVGSIMDFFAMIPATGNYCSLKACEVNGEILYQYIQPKQTAEGYHEMGIEGKIWNYIHHFEDESGVHETPYRYVVKGDTVIGRTVCKKVYYQDDTTERFVFTLIESGREAVRLNPGNNIGTALYDFGRDDIGRVFDWESKYGQGRVYWMLNSIDMVTVREQDYRRLIFLQKTIEGGTKGMLSHIEDDEDAWHEIWIEGVGSQLTGIEPSQHEEPPISTDYTRFVSCYENGVCIFTAEDFAEATHHNELPHHSFVETGKRWTTVQLDADGNPTAFYEYYFLGDTIVDFRPCMKLVRSQVANGVPLDTCSLGACCEIDGQVYYIGKSGESQWQLLYDFNGQIGTDIILQDASTTIVGINEGKVDGFKGECISLLPATSENDSIIWMEGVGGISNPLCNLVSSKSPQREILLNCFYVHTGEMLYYNRLLDKYEAFGKGIHIVKRQSIDFTHTIKIRPHSPRRAAAVADDLDVAITGEYSESDLRIKFPMINGTYTVTLMNAADQEVYRKDVQTNSIVALTRDISQFPEGAYILSIENEDEQYTATLSLPFDETGLSDAWRVNSKSLNSNLFDLSGRRLVTLPAKGLYIRDGKLKRK